MFPKKLKAFERKIAILSHYLLFGYAFGIILFNYSNCLVLSFFTFLDFEIQTWKIQFTSNGWTIILLFFHPLHPHWFQLFLVCLLYFGIFLVYNLFLIIFNGQFSGFGLDQLLDLSQIPSFWNTWQLCYQSGCFLFVFAQIIILSNAAWISKFGQLNTKF